MSSKLILHYRILRRLGEGGMGVVLLAEDTKLQRLVALKFPAPESLRAQTLRQQFLAEARTASALNHPNICTIHAVEELEAGVALQDWAASDGPSLWALDSTAETIRGPSPDAPQTGAEHLVRGATIFIVMEHVTGSSLATRIAAGPVSSGEAFDVAVQMAEGLREAHARGIVHRDIKPHNIMLSGPLVKIMDFGLAYVATSELPHPHGIVGTPAYMSPEQIAGRPLDARTDLFSAGVVIYELLTGERPFIGRDLQQLASSIARDEPLPPSELVGNVPRAFEGVVMRCLRKNPADRYQSAADLIRALTAIREEASDAAAARRNQIDRRDRRGVNRESERRPATIMYGRISRSNGLSDRADEEQMSHDTNELIGLVSDLVAGHGGIVDHVVGGSFTAFFGLPTAAEGSTRRAMNAAIAIRNALRVRNESPTSPDRFEVRIGVNTGTVLAGAIGTSEDRKYSVLGDTVEIASKLHDAAPAGEIYVGPLTRRHVRDEFAFTSVAPLRFHDRQVPIFAVVSVVPVEGPAPVVPTTLSADLVGRDEVLQRLLGCFEALLAGRGAIISLVGEPGVGKSRLVTELLRHETTSRALVLQARADPAGANRGYHPFIHMLKVWAGIHDLDARDEAALKLQRMVSAMARDIAADVFPFLATMMGLSVSDAAAGRSPSVEGDALARLILKNLRMLFERAAVERPLVVLIEDLHWADQSSIELTEKLFRSAEHHPILFLTTSRPGYEETSGRVLDTNRSRYERFHVDVELKPLDLAQSGRLLEALLGTPELPLALTRTILQRAGGNPLFLEEVVRSLVSEGTIQKVDGGMRVTPKAGDVVVPETIQELLIARVDLLDESTRSVLKVASVIGVTFMHAILEVVAPLPELLEQSVAHLLRVQLIRRGEGAEGVEYTFNHALTQESVYGMIVPRARRDLHLRVAAAIEARCAHRLNEFYGMLAFHYSCGENYAKAEDYLTKAGSEAAKASASSEAIHYFKQALELYLRRPGGMVDPDRTGHLERHIGLAFYNKGQMVSAVEHFDRALAHWRAGRPTTRAANAGVLALDAASVFARLYLRTRQPSRVPDVRDNDVVQLMFRKGTAIVSLDSRRYFAESLSTLRRINRFDITKVPQGAAIYATASALFSIPAISFRVSRRILEYTRPFIDSTDPKELLYHRFPELMHDYLSGNWIGATPYDPALVEANAASGEEWFLSVYIVVSAAIQTEQGHFGNAAALVDRLGALGESYENDLIRARRHLSMTRLLMKQRRLELAAAEAERGVPLLQQIDHPMLLLYMYGLKANVALHRNDRSALNQTLQEAASVHRRLGRVPPYYVTSYLVAQLGTHLLDLETAMSCGDTTRASVSRKAAKRLGRDCLRAARMNASDLPEVWRLLGTFEWLAGNRASAFTAWDRSQTEGDRMGARPELARTYAEVARRLREGRNTDRWNGLDADALDARAREWSATRPASRTGHTK